MDDQLLEQFLQLIRRQTGISLRVQDRPHLIKKLLSRCRALNYHHPSQYLALLSNTASGESQREWQHLADLITTGESYFFRDQGQMNILRQHLLPDLIGRHQGDRTLRILSAGCSTGEELYSIAILLKELIPNTDQWQLNLVGYDLSPRAIAHAQAGVYSRWSFRGMDPILQRRYFRETGQGWAIDASFRQWVRFRCVNLLCPAEYDLLPTSVDLIICRNVFIYFNSSAIRQILGTFVSLLRPHGYLLTGHTELQGQEISPLGILSYPESVVYQLSGDKPNSTLPPLVPRQKTCAAPPQVQAQGVLARARALADQGRYSEAIALSQQLLQQDATDVEVLLLLARISQEQGNKAAAKDYLRRVIFLSPNTIAAYVELIELHLSEQEIEPVRSLVATAQTLLQNCPADTMIPLHQGITASMVKHYLQYLTTTLSVS